MHHAELIDTKSANAIELSERAFIVAITMTIAVTSLHWNLKTWLFVKDILSALNWFYEIVLIFIIKYVFIYNDIYIYIYIYIHTFSSRLPPTVHTNNLLNCRNDELTDYDNLLTLSCNLKKAYVTWRTFIDLVKRTRICTCESFARLTSRPEQICLCSCYFYYTIRKTLQNIPTRKMKRANSRSSRTRPWHA